MRCQIKATNKYINIAAIIERVCFFFIFKAVCVPSYTSVDTLTKRTVDLKK